VGYIFIWWGFNCPVVPEIRLRLRHMRFPVLGSRSYISIPTIDIYFCCVFMSYSLCILWKRIVGRETELGPAAGTQRDRQNHKRLEISCQYPSSFSSWFEYLFDTFCHCYSVNPLAFWSISAKVYTKVRQRAHKHEIKVVILYTGRLNELPPWLHRTFKVVSSLFAWKSLPLLTKLHD
jgi:hypothetical protein